MSNEKDEFYEDDHTDTPVEYSILDGEDYDELDDLLYGAFIVEDIQRLNAELDAPQRALMARILRKTAAMFLKREKAAFKKGLAEGWTWGKEERGQGDH